MSARGPTLRIVCINDVYSLENLPRLRALVCHHATTNPADAIMVTLAGDFVSPSILSSLDAGRGMVDCMNAVGVSHAILGNHEDDIPVDELRARLRELRAVVIGTNLPTFDPPLPAHVVVEVAAPGGRSVRVGVVGVVMDDAAVYRHVPFGVAHVEPPNESAMREATRLVRDERCACVVPMTHQTIADDRALAHDERAPKFPVIIGGHEHVPFIEQDEGTWIVKAGSDAINAVVVDLAWPAIAPVDEPDLPHVIVLLDPVAAYEEDAPLRARVDALMARVRDLEAATLMSIAPGETLSSIGTRARQTSLGSLLCSRVRDALDAQACLFNGGGIRGGREYTRHFTYGDLKNEVPFDNEVVAVRLPGRVIREAVAWSRAHAPDESGGFLQVDDRMSVDEPSHVVTRIDGAPLDDAREYCVALVRDFFRGMDHVEPLVRFAIEHPEKIPPTGSGRDVKLVLVDAFALALWKRLGGFDAVDANHDGIVTAKEIAAAVARVTEEAPSSITGDLVLHAVDRNHDDAVSRDEAPETDPSKP
jgi:2',3'-cyclic-nucleotide 2'-phosphodiesterase (5'-nucleotidase family)